MVPQKTIFGVPVVVVFIITKMIACPFLYFERKRSNTSYSFTRFMMDFDIQQFQPTTYQVLI